MTMPDPATVRRVGSNYRRRRPMPAVVLLAVLGLVATIVWIRTIDATEDEAELACGPIQPVTPTEPAVDPGAAGATPPPAGQPTPAQPTPTLGEVLPASALDSVDPLPPDAVRVRVLNASGRRGQATLAAAVLTDDLGFAPASEPADDPLYANGALNCYGQIRFGEAGKAAGRTLSIVMPCLELVKDGRQDDTVDLAIGQRFDNLLPSPNAQEVLRQLQELASQPVDPSGGQQGVAATVDPALIGAARSAVRC